MSSNSEYDGICNEKTPERYAPGSVEDRLLKLDAEAAKKAFHGSRTLKRLGTVFIVFGIVLLVCVEPLLLVLQRVPGFDAMGDRMRIWSILLLPLIAILPAYGVALRQCRSTGAMWLFRIVSVLGCVAGVLSMIHDVRTSNYGAFVGDLVSVLISLRVCVITYSCPLLFGKNAPSHHQLGYVHTKWKSHQKPEHIPEHVHKPKTYVKVCFYLAFLMIPVVLIHALDDLSQRSKIGKAQEYFEKGRKAFDEAGRAENTRDAVDRYANAYFFFCLAASDKTNEDVHVYLGICFARGLGCARSDAEAFHHLSMFPDTTNKYPDAQYLLGMMYLRGRGTDQEIPQAAKLLRAAAEKGQKDARELLGYPPVDPDSPLAADDAPDYGGRTIEEYLIRKLEDMPAEL